MPTECNIEYRITIGQNPVPNDADYPIKFEDNQLLAQDPFIRVIADSNLIYYGGDYLTGTYIVVSRRISWKMGENTLRIIYEKGQN